MESSEIFSHVSIWFILLYFVSFYFIVTYVGHYHSDHHGWGGRTKNLYLPSCLRLISTVTVPFCKPIINKQEYLSLYILITIVCQLFCIIFKIVFFILYSVFWLNSPFLKSRSTFNLNKLCVLFFSAFKSNLCSLGILGCLVFHWVMVEFPRGENCQVKLNPPSLSTYQLPTAPWLVEVFHIHHPFPCWVWSDLNFHKRLAHTVIITCIHKYTCSIVSRELHFFLFVCCLLFP